MIDDDADVEVDGASLLLLLIKKCLGVGSIGGLGAMGIGGKSSQPDPNRPAKSPHPSGDWATGLKPGSSLSSPGKENELGAGE